MSYPPTAAWDIDDAAVHQALAGCRPPLNPAERAEAVRRLNARGWQDPTIARHIACAPETVQRIRARHGIPGVRP